VAATSAPPQSTAFPHGTGVRKTAPPPWKVHRAGRRMVRSPPHPFTERTGRCSRRRPTSRRTRPTRPSYQALHRTQEVTDRVRHDHGHLRWPLASFPFLLLGLLGCLLPSNSSTT